MGIHRSAFDDHVIEIHQSWFSVLPDPVGARLL
jgi:hypothetical protein